MVKNRFFKTTLGVPSEVIIANALAGDADYGAFVDSGSAGEYGVFWDDKDQEAVAEGAALLPENRTKRIFWGWKQGTQPMRSTGFPVEDLNVKTQAYVAGTADVWTVTYGGTFSNGQVIYATIVDSSARAIPYPRWQYSAVVAGGSVDSAVASLAAQINAEKEGPIATASASTTALIVTAIDTRVPLEVLYSMDTTSAQPVDASAITRVHTTSSIAPVGDTIFVTWLESFLQVMAGDPLYYPEGTLPGEWRNFVSNIVGTNTYGIAVVRTWKVERGETRNYADKANLFIALPTDIIAGVADPVTAPIIP